MGSTIFFAYLEREDKRRFEEASVLLERQLLRADLEIGGADKVQKTYGLAEKIWRAHSERG